MKAEKLKTKNQFNLWRAAYDKEAGKSKDDKKNTLKVIEKAYKNLIKHEHWKNIVPIISGSENFVDHEI